MAEIKKASDKYSYDRFGSKGSRVGQAVVDILSNEQPNYTAEEILDEMGKGVIKYLEEAVEEGCRKYQKPFFILHLLKKELSMMGVSNALLQKATCFAHRNWSPQEVMAAHPHATKTLYFVDPKAGHMVLEWTVPGIEDCHSVLKNPKTYDPKLVQWVQEAVPQSLRSRA